MKQHIKDLEDVIIEKDEDLIISISRKNTIIDGLNIKMSNMTKSFNCVYFCPNAFAGW